MINGAIKYKHILPAFARTIVLLVFDLWNAVPAQAVFSDAPPQGQGRLSERQEDFQRLLMFLIRVVRK